MNNVKLTKRAATNGLDRMREPRVIAPPIWMDQAYDDPARVMHIIKKSSPFTLTLKNFDHRLKRAFGPSFRRFCAQGGSVCHDDGAYLLDNPRFVEASRKLFSAEVIRPRDLMVNLTLPFDYQAPAHLDLPRFFGQDRNPPPPWLRGLMGHSGLFVNWIVSVPAALVWFYSGVGGEFEYWPNGTDQPPETIRPPLWNQAVVSDNDYMYHRVAPQGRPKEYLDLELSDDAELHYRSDDLWDLCDKGGKLASYSPEQVRISILWKALAFRSKAEAAHYDSGEDDLDLSMITDIFAGDLRDRGITFRYPDDPANDPHWRAVLTDAYPAPITVHGLWQRSLIAGGAAAQS